MHIRHAKNDDLFKIISFYNKTPYSFFRVSLKDLENLLSAKEPFWIAESDEMILGFIFSANHNQNYSWISGLAIPNPPEDETIADLLLDQIESYFQEKTSTILVWASSRIQNWIGNLFSNRGYSPVCPIKAYEKKIMSKTHQKEIENSLNIRIAKNSDFNIVKTIDEQCFPKMFHYSEDAFTRIFENANIRLVAENTSSQLLGFLLATVHQKYYGNISRVATLPYYRQRGIAKGLMIICLNMMAEMRVKNITLNTQIDNIPAQRLYKSLSFSPMANETVLAKNLS